VLLLRPGSPLRPCVASQRRGAGDPNLRRKTFIPADVQPITRHYIKLTTGRDAAPYGLRRRAHVQLLHNAWLSDIGLHSGHAFIDGSVTHHSAPAPRRPVNAVHSGRFVPQKEK